MSDTGGQCLSMLMTGLCNCITNYTPDFLYQNPIDALFSQINFWNKTLHVSDSSSVHHQEFFTEHGNGICHTACEQDQDGTAVPS